MANDNHTDPTKFPIREARLLYEEIRDAANTVAKMLQLQGKPPLPPMVASLANLLVMTNRFEEISRAKGLTIDAARLIQAHRHEDCGLQGPCDFPTGDEKTDHPDYETSRQRCNLAGEVIALYGLTEPLP